MSLLFFSGVLAPFWSVPAAQAAGFYLQEQSVSALGTAYAGAAAIARDASIVYYNPAAMTALGRSQMYVGGNFIRPRADLDDRGSTVLGAPAGGVDSDNPVDPVVIPNFYAAAPFFDDALWLGFGVSVPFGLATKYEDNWAGRYDSIKSDLKTKDFQASAAFKISDRISLGGGIDLQTAKAELTSAATNGVTEGLSRLEGNDSSLGWNVGIYAQPWDNTRIGLSYRSEVGHELEGHISASGVPGLNEFSKGTAGLDLPDIASFGIAHDCGERLTLLGQATWFGWNDYEKIKAVRENGTVASTTIQNYQATLNFSAGAEYKWDDALTLRGGYQFDETPTSDEYRTTRTPDGDRHWFTLGGSYEIDDNISLDAAAAYIAIDDAAVDVLRNSDLARVKLERHSGSTGLLSLGISYKF